MIWDVKYNELTHPNLETYLFEINAKKDTIKFVFSCSEVLKNRFLSFSLKLFFLVYVCKNKDAYNKISWCFLNLKSGNYKIDFIISHFKFTNSKISIKKNKFICIDNFERNWTNNQCNHFLPACPPAAWPPAACPPAACPPAACPPPAIFYFLVLAK